MINLELPVLFIVIFISIRTISELWLESLNYSHVTKLRGPIPESWPPIFTQSTFDKTLNYTLAKSSLNKAGLIYSSILLAAILLFNLLPRLFYGLQSLLGLSLPAQSLTLLLITLILALPDLPLAWWSQFKIENNFGFNRSTLGLWISDKIKGSIISLILGFPLIWAFLKFYQSFPQTWWIWSIAIFISFQATLQLLYPWIILPLFNKRMSLPDNDLKEKLLALAKKADFSAKTIHVIDGSKRSSHSNAFFSGFGKFRCIILFDTLLTQLTPNEIGAVLAHEIGHYKKGHIPKRLIAFAFIGIIGFKIIDWLIQQENLYSSFGFSTSSGVAPMLLLFAFFSGAFFFWLTPIFNAWSRKHEFEADAFAKELQGSETHLISALHKLHKENLSNLDPHPAYSTFHYSHPTLIERERALKQKV